MGDTNGLVPTELATYWANVWYNNFGKNATATKFTPGGGSTSGGGVGRPKGYADGNGTSSVNNEGNLTFVAKYCFTNDRYHFVDSFSITDTYQDANKIWHFGSSSIQVESYSKNVSDIYAYGGYVLDTQNISGIFYIPKGTTFVLRSAPYSAPRSPSRPAPLQTTAPPILPQARKNPHFWEMPQNCRVLSRAISRMVLTVLPIR